jgi:hypothetical protein
MSRESFLSTHGDRTLETWSRGQERTCTCPEFPQRECHPLLGVLRKNMLQSTNPLLLLPLKKDFLDLSSTSLLPPEQEPYPHDPAFGLAFPASSANGYPYAVGRLRDAEDTGPPGVLAPPLSAPVFGHQPFGIEGQRQALGYPLDRGNGHAISGFDSLIYPEYTWDTGPDIPFTPPEGQPYAYDSSQQELPRFLQTSHRQGPNINLNELPVSELDDLLQGDPPNVMNLFYDFSSMYPCSQ